MNKMTFIIHEASELPFKPRIERIDTNGQRPKFRTVYGDDIENHFQDDVSAFKTHGNNIRHAAECAGLLESTSWKH